VQKPPLISSVFPTLPHHLTGTLWLNVHFVAETLRTFLSFPYRFRERSPEKSAGEILLAPTPIPRTGDFWGFFESFPTPVRPLRRTAGCNAPRSHTPGCVPRLQAYSIFGYDLPLVPWRRFHSDWFSLGSCNPGRSTIHNPFDEWVGESVFPFIPFTVMSSRLRVDL